MDKMRTIAETLARINTGEYCTAKEWDTKRIPGAVNRVLKKYGLAKTLNRENPVNFDYGLADTFFAAAFDMALEVGYLCVDTERIVKVSQEELECALKFAPKELYVGYQPDGTLARARTPADPFTLKAGCSFGIACTEDIFPYLQEGIARERDVDILGGGTLVTIFGQEVRSATPIETLAGYEHARMHVEARRKAGRPGMAGIGVYTAVTEYGQFGGYGVPGGQPPTDLSLILFPAEHKIDYRTLHKVVHTINVGGMVKATCSSSIGGMAGPPEGAALSTMSSAILSYAILNNQAGGGQIFDGRVRGSANRDGLWALSVATQGLSRNTDLIIDPCSSPFSACNTEELLYEIAAGSAMLASSGASLTWGPRPALGMFTNHITPLECRFLAEVAHAASALEPKKVNDIVNQILPYYEDKIKNPDHSNIQPLSELYDLETLQPIEEWEAKYHKVKKNLIKLGIPLDDYGSMRKVA
jgi:methylamine---corrinoid protein Co-methyltransferase